MWESYTFTKWSWCYTRSSAHLLRLPSAKQHFPSSELAGGLGANGRRWKPGGKSSVEKQPPARQHLLLPLSEPFSSFDSSLQLTPTNDFDSCRCCQLKAIVSLEPILVAESDVD